jgi:hypothetical protein
MFQTSAFAAVCFVAVPSGFATCPQTGPTTTYQFVGQCSDCYQTGVGLLTLRNYTPGTQFNYSCNFVSFTYYSNLINYTVTPSNLYNAFGTLPASLPAAASVFVETNGGLIFESSTDGDWNVGETDYGSSSLWSLAPASVPAVSVPMLIGLAVMLALIGTILLKGIPRRRAV